MKDAHYSTLTVVTLVILFNVQKRIAQTRGDKATL